MTRALALAAAAALACGPPDPGPLPRVLAAAPVGKDVPTSAAARVWFSVPLDPAELEAGRIVLAEAAALAQVLGALESDAGARGAGLAVRAVLEEGGRCVALHPEAPLRAHLGHAVAISSRLHAADGRVVLDAAGRRRASVITFETGAAAGPPPRPVLTEVRADAEAPEAGGEYVEVANAGEGALDLRGWRLGKRTSSGALAWCTIEGAAGGALAPGAVALVAGGAWDGRYALPAGVPVLTCGATALAGGLANDRAPELLLADPVGTIAATLGAAGAPLCPIAVERLEPGGADAPANLRCTAGSPGWP